MTVEERLERIEAALVLLVERPAIREWYTVEEFARIAARAEFTVREWCRHGRLRAGKRLSGRGAHVAWAISHEELLRYQREGLLPPLDGADTKQEDAGQGSGGDGPVRLVTRCGGRRQSGGYRRRRGEP
jgi:hypothetical protein